MKVGQSGSGWLAAWCAILCVAQPAYAATSDSVSERRAPAFDGAPPFGQPPSSTGRMSLANQSLAVKPRPGGPARTSAGPAAHAPQTQRAGNRAANPLHVTTAADAGEPGYVHYFLLRLPDESLEIQVGIELADRKIAWSFPDLGVAVSQLMEAGTVRAGGKDYEVWHLYGIRPFPDDPAMSALRRELPGRINRWVEAGTPYCENDGPGGDCMSCLGFVLRALFPGRESDFPDMPRDFWRMGYAGRYSTHDLLLYLTGMLDLSTREARLRRISQLTLPDALRDDLLDLVHGMSEAERAPGAGTSPGAPQKRPAQRKRL